VKQSLYEAVGGRDAVLNLAHAWHRRCLADPLASHPFSHPGLHPEHTDRLAAYWAEAWGGPPVFSQTLGDETHVIRLHSGNGKHPELDERCIELFVLALEDAEIPVDLRPTLEQYFREATERMDRYPASPGDVPDGLSIPHWPPAE
jgi:hemoglobin